MEIVSFLSFMDYAPLIEIRSQRLVEIETLMGDPEFFNDQKTSANYMREHRNLKKLIAFWDEYKQTEKEIAGNEELLKEGDEEFA